MERPAVDRLAAARLGGSKKLDDLIEAKLRREYTKAVRRISKRKWRVPEILSQLPVVKGKERKKLEDELVLLMRKAKIDNELVRKFGPIYSDESGNNKSKRKKSNQEDLESLDSSSVSSFQRQAAAPPPPSVGRYTKNRSAAKTDGSKFSKKSSELSRTFESGYSSLDEYISGGDSRVQDGLVVKKKEEVSMMTSTSEQDLPVLVKQIERERVRPDVMINKMSEMGVEAVPRVQARQEIQVAAAGGGGGFDPNDGFEHDDDDELNRPDRLDFIKIFSLPSYDI